MKRRSKLSTIITALMLLALVCFLIPESKAEAGEGIIFKQNFSLVKSSEDSFTLTFDGTLDNGEEWTWVAFNDEIVDAPSPFDTSISFGDYCWNSMEEILTDFFAGIAGEINVSHYIYITDADHHGSGTAQTITIPNDCAMLFVAKTVSEANPDYSAGSTINEENYPTDYYLNTLGGVRSMPEGIGEEVENQLAIEGTMTLQDGTVSLCTDGKYMLNLSGNLKDNESWVWVAYNADIVNQEVPNDIASMFGFTAKNYGDLTWKTLEMILTNEVSSVGSFDGMVTDDGYSGVSTESTVSFTLPEDTCMVFFGKTYPYTEGDMNLNYRISTIGGVEAMPTEVNVAYGNQFGIERIEELDFDVNSNYVVTVSDSLIDGESYTWISLDEETVKANNFGQDCWNTLKQAASGTNETETYSLSSIISSLDSDHYDSTTSKSFAIPSDTQMLFVAKTVGDTYKIHQIGGTFSFPRLAEHECDKLGNVLEQDFILSQDFQVTLLESGDYKLEFTGTLKPGEVWTYVGLNDALINYGAGAYCWNWLSEILYYGDYVIGDLSVDDIVAQTISGTLSSSDGNSTTISSDIKMLFVGKTKADENTDYMLCSVGGTACMPRLVNESVGNTLGEEKIIESIFITVNPNNIPVLHVGEGIPNYSSLDEKYSPFTLCEGIDYESNIFIDDEYYSDSFGFGYYEFDPEGEYIDSKGNRLNSAPCFNMQADAETKYAYYIELSIIPGYKLADDVSLASNIDTHFCIEEVIPSQSYIRIRYDMGNIEEIRELIEDLGGEVNDNSLMATFIDDDEKSYTLPFMSDSHKIMAYREVKTGGYDIIGNVDEAWRQSQFNQNWSDFGIDFGAYSRDKNNQATNDISIKCTPSIINNGKAVKLTYVLTNNSKESRYSTLFAYGDTCVNGNDESINTVNESGTVLTMQDQEVAFFAYSTDSDFKIMPSDYNKIESYLGLRSTGFSIYYEYALDYDFTQGNEDSAFWASWDEVELAPGASKQFVLICRIVSSEDVEETEKEIQKEEEEARNPQPTEPAVPIIIIPSTPDDDEPTTDVSNPEDKKDTEEGSSDPSKTEEGQPTDDKKDDTKTDDKTDSSDDKSGETEHYTIPVTAEDTVQIDADITDNTAVVSEITPESINETIRNSKPESQKQEEKTDEDTPTEVPFDEEEQGNVPEQQPEDDSDKLTIDLSEAEQDVTGITLTKESVENISNAIKDDTNDLEALKFKMTDAEVEFDGAALDAISEQAEGDTLKLVVEDTDMDKYTEDQKESLLNHNVISTFEAYIESNGQRIHDFKGGSATVSIRFTPAPGTDPKHYHIFYVAEDGLVEQFITRFFKGYIQFTTGHFSDYVITYDESLSNETADDYDPTAYTDDDEDITDSSYLLTDESKYDVGIKLNSNLNIYQRTGRLIAKWGEVEEADGYYVYAAYCGETGYERVAVIKGSDITKCNITTIHGEPLDMTRFFKVYVVAYKNIDGKNRQIGTSLHTHVAGMLKDDYTNIRKINLETKKATLSAGETMQVNATYTVYHGKEDCKLIQHISLFRFRSSDQSVATVTSDGQIVAVGSGTCTIYVYAANGRVTSMTITVK